MRSIHIGGLVCLLVIFVGACKPDSTENAPAAAKAASEPTDGKSDGLFGGIFSDEPKPATLDLGEFKLLEVNLGTSLDSDNLVTHPKTQFGTRDKIHASVLSTGKHQGLSIKAKWTAPDGSLITETEQALVPSGGTVSTFAISNAEAWPVGNYTLDISLNGLIQKTITFEIK